MGDVHVLRLGSVGRFSVDCGVGVAWWLIICCINDDSLLGDRAAIAEHGKQRAKQAQMLKEQAVILRQVLARRESERAS